MLTLNIKIDNIEITENNTTIITMAPINNIRWISNPELISAGIAVLPYGVITVPEDATTTGLMVTAVVNGIPYQVELSALLEGTAGDEITLKQPSLSLEDLTDVSITDAADGQALVYDATAQKWVNGAGGGGGENISFNTIEGSALVRSGTNEDVFDIPITLEPVSLMGGTVYGHYMPPAVDGVSFKQSDIPVYAIEFTIDGVKYTTNYIEYDANEPYYLLMDIENGGIILGYGDHLFFMAENKEEITFSMVWKKAEPTAFFVHTIQEIVSNLGSE